MDTLKVKIKALPDTSMLHHNIRLANPMDEGSQKMKSLTSIRKKTEEIYGQIADVENQIYKKRVEYNDAVNVYNTRFLTFPVNLIGGMLGFSKQPYFEWTNKPEWAFSEKSSSGELPISMETEGIQNGR